MSETPSVKHYYAVVFNPETENWQIDMDTVLGKVYDETTKTWREPLTDFETEVNLLANATLTFALDTMNEINNGYKA